jgi:uncharacterized lipoprotein YbaY
MVHGGAGSLVRGEVIFPREAGPLRDARVFVLLEEVSLADAPAVIVGRQVQEHTALPGGGAALPFEVHAPPPDPRASYSVRVHVDLDGDGEIGPGDYVSTAGYPVLTRGHPDEAAVEVRLV